MLPKIGIVGSPDQISLLVPVLQAIGYPVTALWCKDIDTRRKLSMKFRTPFLPGDFKELLLHPEVDLVYVAIEPGRQAEVAVKAITSGKHCICQKPPSINQAEAQKMVRLSRYYSKLLSMLETHLRFMPAVRKLKKLLSEGYCGQLLVMEAHILMGSLIQDEAYSWKCAADMGGGALNLLGADIIDLISYLSDQHARKGYASLSTFCPTTHNIHGYRTITSDDFCCFQLKYSGGLAASVTLNSHVPGQYDFQFSVTGTQGRLVIRGLDLVGTHRGSKEETLLKQCQPDLQRYGIKASNKYPLGLLHHVIVGYQSMFESLKCVFLEDSTRKECVKITTSLVKQHSTTVVPFSASFEDGVYIRTVLDALHCSNAEGKWVDIPELGMVEPSNPFWTSSRQRESDHDNSSPSTIKSKKNLIF